MRDCKPLVRRYYAEVWNTWSATALEELISPDITFRGSIDAGDAKLGVVQDQGVGELIEDRLQHTRSLPPRGEFGHEMAASPRV